MLTKEQSRPASSSEEALTGKISPPVGYNEESTQETSRPCQGIPSLTLHRKRVSHDARLLPVLFAGIDSRGQRGRPINTGKALMQKDMYIEVLSEEQGL